jgi:hypothetical protein
MLYFRILASRIPSVLLGTSALLITAFCTEIFELSIPIGYPYSRDRHPHIAPSAPLQQRAPFEAAPASALENSPFRVSEGFAGKVSKGETTQKALADGPPYVWKERGVCGREPFGVNSQPVTIRCKRHRGGGSVGLAPANPRSALDPRNFRRAEQEFFRSDGGVPTCPERPSAACFTRLRHVSSSICFLHNKVVICQRNKSRVNSDQNPSRVEESKSTSRADVPAGDWAGASLPGFMRFHGEALTLPLEVTDRECQEREGVQTLALAADDRFLPLDKPNPYHEAEKLIPAIFLSRVHNSALGGDSLLPTAETLDLTKGEANQEQEAVRRPRMFWFKDPATLSIWAEGFLRAFNISISYGSDLHREHTLGSALTQKATDRKDQVERLQESNSGGEEAPGGEDQAEMVENTGGGSFVMHRSLKGEGVALENVYYLANSSLGGVKSLAAGDREESDGNVSTTSPSDGSGLISNSTGAGGNSYMLGDPGAHLEKRSLHPNRKDERGQLLNSSESDPDSRRDQALSDTSALAGSHGGSPLNEPLALSFMELPHKGEPPICFDDAVILSPPTYGAFVPDVAANDWLRSQALGHCGILEVRLWTGEVIWIRSLVGHGSCEPLFWPLMKVQSIPFL